MILRHGAPGASAVPCSGEDVAVIRMLATDLDGTLLRPDNTVSRRTVAALAAARDAGFPVVFVTGRPTRWMAPVVAATGHAGVAVCSNGGLLVDLDAGAVLQAWPLPADAVLDLATGLRTLVLGAGIAVEYIPGRAGSAGTDVLGEASAFGQEPHFNVREPRVGALVAPLEELVAAGPIVKVLARGPVGADPDELLAAARRLVGDRAEVTHSSTTDPLLELSAIGVSKATTLAGYAAAAGIASAEVAAVGDMPNDVAMLAWSGSSYAVEGSHPAALAAAGGRVAPAVEDGVARLLESLLAA